MGRLTLDYTWNVSLWTWRCHWLGSYAGLLGTVYPYLFTCMKRTELCTVHTHNTHYKYGTFSTLQRQDVHTKGVFNGFPNCHIQCVSGWPHLQCRNVIYSKYLQVVLILTIMHVYWHFVWRCNAFFLYFIMMAYCFPASTRFHSIHPSGKTITCMCSHKHLSSYAHSILPFACLPQNTLATEPTHSKLIYSFNNNMWG